MINYEKRILKFLATNPKLKFNSLDMARLWKRNEQDVLIASLSLQDQGLIKELKNGALRLA